MEMVTAILAVFTSVFGWIGTSLGTIATLFWDGSNLTFLGLLGVISLGIGIFFLLMRVIQNFLQFRS